MQCVQLQDDLLKMTDMARTWFLMLLIPRASVGNKYLSVTYETIDVRSEHQEVVMTYVYSTHMHVRLN